MSTHEEAEIEQAKRIARLETKMDFLTETIVQMNQKMDNFYTNFVTKDMLDLKLQNLSEKVAKLESDKQQTKQTLPGWFQVLTGIGAIIVAVVALFYGK